MYALFTRPAGADDGKARPPGMEPTIREIRGHAIYRRPERCPVCGGRTDLFLTGTPGVGDHLWTWIRPHPACVLRSIAGRCSTRSIRNDSESPVRIAEGALEIEGNTVPIVDGIPLGPIRVGSAVWGRPERLGQALDAQRRGDFGSFGRLEDLPPGFDPWCPGAYPVATRNALALAERRGLLWGRFPAGRGGPELVVLTALLGEAAATLVVPSSLLRPEDLDPAELIDLPVGPSFKSRRQARGRHEEGLARSC